MLQQIILGIVRHVLTLGGGYLLQKGLTDQNGVNVLISSIITILGVVWSILHKINSDSVAPGVKQNFLGGVSKAVIIAALLLGGSLALPSIGSAQTLGKDLQKAESDFISGDISNMLVLGGGNYLEKSHQVGGELILGYNTPSLTAIPLQPRIIPLFGIEYLGSSYEGVTASASLQADLHVLREFAGTATNGFLYTFTLTPNTLAGVAQNISGETFGSVIIPGKAPLNGKGTGAITGYGATVGIFKTASLSLFLWGERVQITTIAGTDDMGGIGLTYSPKGW